MAAAAGSVPVTLVLGEEELLAERAVAGAVDAARERLGPGTSVEEVRGGGLPGGFALGLAPAARVRGGRRWSTPSARTSGNWPAPWPSCTLPSLRRRC